MKISERLKSKTPLFFKQVQRVSAGLIAIAGSVLALEATYQLELNPKLSKLAEWVLVAGTVAGGIARLTKENE